ncbi:MAG: hypothetical protein ABIL16_05595 [candidate division WOR-3 bacterium]
MKGILYYPYKALTVKKISLAFIWVLIGAVLYSSFTYLAYYVSGLDLSRVWEINGLFPIPIWAKTFPKYLPERGGNVLFPTDFEVFNFWGKVLWFLGVYGVIYSYFSAGIGISRFVIEEERGDPFYPFLDALKESFKKSGLFITSTLTVISSFVIVIIVHLLISLWGNFKGLVYLTGAVLIIVFPFLVVLSALFLYLILGFLSVVIFGPVVSTSMEGDTFDLFYEGFTILNERLVKAIFLEGINFAVKIFSFSLFSYVFLRAVLLSLKILTLISPRLKFILYSNIDLVSFPQLHPLLSQYFAFIIPREFFVPIATPIPSPLTNTFSIVFSVWFFVFMFVCSAVYVSLTWTGRTYVYREMVKDKDGLDIFAIKPKLLNFKVETQSQTE